MLHIYFFIKLCYCSCQLLRVNDHVKMASRVQVVLLVEDDLYKKWQHRYNETECRLCLVLWFSSSLSLRTSLNPFLWHLINTSVSFLMCSRFWKLVKVHCQKHTVNSGNRQLSWLRPPTLNRHPWGFAQSDGNSVMSMQIQVSMVRFLGQDLSLHHSVRLNNISTMANNILC